MDAKTPLFPSAFDVKAPEGAEGWEGLYPYYTRFQPSRRAEDLTPAMASSSMSCSA